MSCRLGSSRFLPARRFFCRLPEAPAESGGPSGPEIQKKPPAAVVFRKGRQWDLALHAAPGMKCARIG